jgi:flagellar hook assembly protein FlgD
MELSAIPNPYSDQTTIGFTLASPSEVKIEVHDMNGRKVATVSERQYLAGTHSVTWNAAEIPAGVYVVSITAGGRSEALVTVLVR